MSKQNITRHTYLCKNRDCGHMTTNYDGYCDDCSPPLIFTPHEKLKAAIMAKQGDCYEAME